MLIYFEAKKVLDTIFLKEKKSLELTGNLIFEQALKFFKILLKKMIMVKLQKEQKDLTGF